jgi:flagellar biosynthesis GTPase FlhF
LLEKGVDLGEVSGTPFNLEKEYERKSPQKSMKVKKPAHRKVIACIVMDMKNRGIDPLDYFSTHQERTMSILDLPVATAQQLAQQYEANLEMYGQITVPKEGELSVKEKMAQAAADPKAQKAAAKKAKEEEKARLKAEREEAKAKTKQAKEEEKRLKQEEKARVKQAKEEEKKLKQQEKEKAKMLKESGKVAAAAAAAASSVAAGSAASSIGAGVPGENPIPSESTQSTVIEGQASSNVEESESGDADTIGTNVREAGTSSVGHVDSPKVASTSKGNILSSIKPLPAGGAVLLVAGGGYTIKMFQDKAAAEEEERQRQFRMLMGEISDSSPTSSSAAPALEEVDDDSPSITPVKDISPTPAPVPAPPAPSKKRRLGIFKKKSERETDITKLVSPDARASEFATLLAKILTFGAPGRFPSVEVLPGDKPFDTFDLDLAKQLLIESRTKDDIPTEESAEVFANVVNCMLIDIVDLASTSLKEKDSQKTIDALGIVVEFMNHAASLYDAVAESVTIKPVVYEGTLSKSKLEQMFSTYAASGMSNLDDLPEDFDSRVNLLQDVFQISEKKAEGLMMKAMQKQMMEMMKDPKKMEEMMSSMGGMEGMADLMGGGENGEGIDTEQLMAMMRDLKAAKDRGEISQKDLESVRSMFKEAFGSSIDSIDESEVSDEDREVLAAMKEILDG